MFRSFWRAACRTVACGASVGFGSSAYGDAGRGCPCAANGIPHVTKWYDRLCGCTILDSSSPTHRSEDAPSGVGWDLLYGD